MKNIDKLKPVMVSGANGYVASWLVKRLLDEGITVHAAVRDPENLKKVGHLVEMGKSSKGTLKLFKSDLLTPNSYKDAMEDCELVFHTASPFIIDVKDAQKDLVDPAVIGTENILTSANNTSSVKRIVLTSSCASIYSDSIDCRKAPNGILTEEIWNTTASLLYNPYSYSKTMAEKKAWDINKAQLNWDLVTINPSFVMGPALNPGATTSESLSILKQMGDGTMKMGVPKMGAGVVDVRDVADAHFEAGYRPNAQGRYITSAHNTNFLEMGQALLPKFGANFPIPKKALPKWLLMIVGPMANKLFTRDLIRNNVNIEFKADNSKIKKDLGLQFIPLQKTMEDAFQVLVDEKIVTAK
jgi:nucleoside-diphosphate-sugar epimerase